MPSLDKTHNTGIGSRNVCSLDLDTEIEKIKIKT